MPRVKPMTANETQKVLGGVVEALTILDETDRIPLDGTDPDAIRSLMVLQRARKSLITAMNKGDA